MSTTLPGARESSAGDDFHLLWASIKGLELLRPNSQLVCITIEGPSKEDSKIDINGDKLLAVDIAEYFNGRDALSATEIVISQLKYSTRNPGKEWTGSDFRKSTKKNGSNSIIFRFGESLKAYKSLLDNDVSKLTIKFVSNRPMGNLLKKVFSKVKQICESKDISSIEDITVDMCKLEAAELNKVFSCCDLAINDFIDLFKCLNISECGSDSRFSLKGKIIKLLNDFNYTNATSQLSALKQLIWSKMMPESACTPQITKYDILHTLNVSYNQLFPCPPQLKRTNKLIVRHKVQEDILDLVLNSPSKKPIIIHSIGGIGKSTIIQQLEESIPDGSIVIKYDCYGNGEYKSLSGNRYKSHRVILQIANELSNITGLPYTVNSDRPIEDLFAILMSKIKDAVKIVRSINSDAIVLIIIDAADNSINAALANNEKCFINQILAEEFINGSHLLLTTRSEHKQKLGKMPLETQYELLAFSQKESAEHLKLYYPDATEAQATDFHNLTKGIPRMQTYILEKKEGSIESNLNFLRPDGKNLNEYFEDLMEYAAKKNGLSDTIKEMITSCIISN